MPASADGPRPRWAVGWPGWRATHQVIVVTHLAQVAAFADRHIVVDKPDSRPIGGVSRSDVRVVEGDDRVAELARMLAGSDSATARRTRRGSCSIRPTDGRHRRQRTGAPSARPHRLRT